MPKYVNMRLRLMEKRPFFHAADHGKVQARLLLLKKFSSSERPSSICGSSGRSAVRCLASAIAKDGRKNWMRSTPIMHWCCQECPILPYCLMPLWYSCSSLNLWLSSAHAYERWLIWLLLLLLALYPQICLFVEVHISKWFRDVSSCQLMSVSAI